ncbi:MAG: protein translocase subunit SecD [Actinobacteria bacterium]|nr:protein translocase subunit SecD [Actinomycetota bacterium]MSW25021.1 protein translocase subunit SecD [Actinomycetota bacterium]MSX29239.1 protein translocase subunit SecD [Actinomycetota bacterium]MSX97086.1 protein translocase subunit SecD [Actinomycetota bacterium]MSY53154.1 protein translocase subunit SecD [Actinomycetota bacterium]
MFNEKALYVAKHYRPGRSLLIFLVSIVGLAVWAFWPGQNHAPKLGLDLRGGTQVILSPQVAAGATLSPEQLNQTVAIIRQRVDGFGVAESEVTIQGTGDGAKIIVTIPGETSRTVVDQLKTTAQLNFRAVVAIDYGSPQPSTSPTPSDSASPAASATASATASASPSASASPTPTPSPSVSVAPELMVPPIQSPDASGDFPDRFAALDCATSDIKNGATDDPAQYLISCEKDGSIKYVLAPADLVGTDIEGATAGLPQQGAGGWQVDLQMTTEGAKKFADSTTTLSAQQTPNNQFAIVLDGVVISAPAVNEPILGGSAVISGSFTADEARALAQVLKFGALPVSLDVDEVQQISPTLGNDQLHAGLLAGGFGLLLVIIYLLLYYRALGVVAVVSLFAAAIMTYLIFILLGRGIGFTLTLSGIAGAIVAIGITADSFVIYFERIRDEIREGKRLRAAVDQGWTRARRTILAADFVSLLAAVILYYLSVGSVRGFAFTLGLITFVDIAVAFMFTRSLVTKLGNSHWMNAGSAWTGVSPERLGVTKTAQEVN